MELDGRPRPALCMPAGPINSGAFCGRIIEPVQELGS